MTTFLSNAQSLSGNRRDCPESLLQIIMDEVDEIVYVSDTTTYEILYLNEFGKKEFGITDIGNGKKCYEVLQGLDAPCPFCTNPFLNCETFYIWEITNPVSHRHYLLRDKLIHWNGYLARLEFAVDITEKENISQAVQRKLDIESTLLECIRILNREENFPQAVDMVLENLGTMHQADRAYIFEYSVLKSGELIANNTYEWCSEGISPQKEALQNVPFSCISCWQKMFERREDVVIDNLESIRDSDLDMYNVLKPQGIERLIVVPLVLNDVISGFIGVDNPKANQDDHSLLHSLAYFVTNEQRKRNMQSELKRMSYCDGLTGLHNRNSYISVLQKLEKNPPDSLGVVFVDLNGLKRINDQQGHDSGDKYIRDISRIFSRYFRGDDLFRIGGDEFVFLCRNIPKRVFHEKLAALRREANKAYPESLSLGQVWAEGDVHIMDMVKQADKRMYQEKAEYRTRRGDTA